MPDNFITKLREFSGAQIGLINNWLPFPWFELYISLGQGHAVKVYRERFRKNAYCVTLIAVIHWDSVLYHNNN
jgi:hypothetical protein